MYVPELFDKNKVFKTTIYQSALSQGYCSCVKLNIGHTSGQCIHVGEAEFA